MNAGRLRDVVTIQEQSGSQDSFGEPAATWTDVFSDYAEVKQLTGREFFNDARVAADVDTRVVIRYRDGIKAKQRVLCGTRILDIQSVVMDQKKTQCELLCKEVA